MNRDLLLVPMQENDAGAFTVGGYLQALLLRLWECKEGFSGKRPFGNSGWENELHRALITAGKVPDGKLDEEGYVLEDGSVDDVVMDAIKALFAEPAAADEADRLVLMALRQEVARREARPAE
jgi:hypothetical protein